jgi:hypothetical protein
MIVAPLRKTVAYRATENPDGLRRRLTASSILDHQQNEGVKVLL